MKTLNVVDLDHTLIKIDSFRILVQRNMGLRMIGLMAGRVTGLLNRSRFSGKAAQLVEPKLHETAYRESFLDELEGQIDSRITAMLSEADGSETTTLILSASPQLYVLPFAKRLGFDGAGSTWEPDGYFHCRGIRKKEYLLRHYPTDQFEYGLAIGDSPSDRPMLDLFERGIQWEP
jgi:phosphoserine phosphatase